MSTLLQDFDKKVESIVSMGYTPEEAKQALEENEGDVDDAIDFLFSKGRVSPHSPAATRKASTYSEDDMTVSDVTVSDVTVSGSTQSQLITTEQTRATPSFSLMALASAERKTRYHPASHTPGMYKNGIDRVVSPPQTDPPTGTTSLPNLPVPANKNACAYGVVDPAAVHIKNSKTFSEPVMASSATGEKRQAVKDFDVEAQSNKSSSRESMPHPALNTNQTLRMHPHQPSISPGAFAIVGGGARDVAIVGGGARDDLMTGSHQQPLHQAVTAELVDPDQENQILEQRLQEELEAEHKRAAVAQVVSEEELKSCHWRRVICIIGFVLAVFAVALGVSLKFARPLSPPGAPEPTLAPTFPPPPQEIIDLIAPKSFDDGASLYDSSSPQSAAARWLADNEQLGNYTNRRKLQRYALATLYYSTNGDDWTEKQKWLSDSNECVDWWVKDFDSENTLLKCDTANAITLLLIENNNMVGTLPDEIAFLSDSMFDLRMYSNDIKGTLPSTLEFMTMMKILDLRSNRLSGSIPTTLGRLTALQDLRLYENSLVGVIPTEMALMTSLKDLRLQSNKLNGTISGTTFGSLTALDTLQLSENNFTSTIPTEIGLLTLLEELKLHRNNLTGPLPEIGLLTALEKFACHDNTLTGPLPTELGLLTALKDELRMEDNDFTGIIPSEIALLSSLEILRLGGNSLTGTIHANIGLLPALKRLELHANLLTGSIPTELGLLTLMSDLRLYANNLTGTVLQEFTQFVDLKGLNLHNNSLTGTLPEFGYLTRIKDLRAGFNMLSGSIPTSIARLTSLEELMLSNNMLTGTIPPLENFTNLQKVHLYNNSFSGAFTCPVDVIDCYISCFVPNSTACRSLL